MLKFYLIGVIALSLDHNKQIYINIKKNKKF